MDEVAQAENLIPSYVTRLVRLTFLAPDITASILSGRHDPDLTASRLMADTRFPIDWKDQRPPSHQPDRPFQVRSRFQPGKRLFHLKSLTGFAPTDSKPAATL